MTAPNPFWQQARQVRRYIAEHPGSTALEVAEACDCWNAGKILFWMQVRGLAKHKKGGKHGPAVWFVVPMVEEVDEP